MADAGMLLPSAHVALLQQHTLKHSGQATMDDLMQLHELAPTPQPQLSPASSAGSVDGDAQTAPLSPSPSHTAVRPVALPLPSGWAALRAEQLRLPCEKRMLRDLCIDTADAHLLRRGLWIACASLFLPQLLDIEEALAETEAAEKRTNGCTQPTAAAADAVAPAACGGCASASVTPAPAPLALESVGDVRVPPTFEVSVVVGGITNQLYRASLKSHPNQPVLVRIYGQTHESRTAPQCSTELRWMRFLAAKLLTSPQCHRIQ
jgi:hypothetical protein